MEQLAALLKYYFMHTGTQNFVKILGVKIITRTNLSTTNKIKGLNEVLIKQCNSLLSNKISK